MTTQTIGLIGTFTLAVITLLGYIVLSALGQLDAAQELIKVIGGLGLATAIQGAAILTAGKGS